MSLLGVQAQGAFYLGCSPFKLEYSAYVSNGLNLTPATPGAPTIDELANLENMTSTFSPVTNDHAFGGRLGLWWPEMGLETGISGLFNGDYVAGGFEDQITLFAVDFNYHMGDWDVRAEYGRTLSTGRVVSGSITSRARACTPSSPTGRWTPATSTCRTPNSSTVIATSISRGSIRRRWT